MRPEIARAIREELREMDILGDIRLRELQDKEGVAVCRVYAEGRRYVLKYFERAEFRREIRNYQILAFEGIPTVEVLLYTGKSILMEDIACSPSYRLGREKDCADPAAARLIARWYRTLHERGAEAADLPSLRREDACLTGENMELLRESLGPFPGEKQLPGQLSRLRNALEALPRTLCYNDFYWSNLAVARDGSSALLFDYNLLGQGYRYSDVRNVLSSLTPEAGEAFLAEYGPVSQEERLADAAAAPLVTLVNSCRFTALPAWAEASFRSLKDGSVERALRNLLR